MDRFSAKSLIVLGEYYVYGLIDPRDGKIFYIGKGTRNRVFEHEKESINSINSDKLKLKTIRDIKNAGLKVEKIIINYKLSQDWIWRTICATRVALRVPLKSECQCH